MHYQTAYFVFIPHRHFSMHSYSKCYGVLTLYNADPRFRDYTSEQNTQVPTSRALPPYLIMTVVKGANNNLEPHSKGDTCSEIWTKNHRHHYRIHEAVSHHCIIHLHVMKDTSGVCKN